jgi:putative MATE family efflux protein
MMDLTQGSVGKKLLVFSLPIMMGMLLQTAYNIIDAIYIGMLGPQELAAVSITFPVIFVFISVAGGLGIGANALMAQAIGRKHVQAANNIAEHAVFLGPILGIILAALGILFSPQIFTFMGADQALLDLTLTYSTPIFIGMIFMFVWFISDAILRAQGNSKTPMINLGVSVVLNIFLNPILIFGLFGVPALGLFGAAMATIFSRVIAAALNFIYIYTPKSIISLDFKAFKPRMDYVKQILFIGLPASGTQSLTALGFMLLTSLVGGFGSFALAAFGVGMRVTSVVMLPLIGLTSGLISFVGQNIGVRDFERAKRVTWLATKMAFFISLFMAVAIYLLRENIMLVFTQDATVIAIGVSYLSIMPFAYIFYGLYHVIFGAFQGAGKTVLTFQANLVYWVLAVALAFYLSGSQGLEGIWWALVIAAVLELFVVAGIYWSGAWLKNIKSVH